MIADTSSPVITEMDENPISGRGYRPYCNRFPLNVQSPNEITSDSVCSRLEFMVIWITERSFFKDKHNTLL